MSNVIQALNNIKEVLEKAYPSKTSILNDLFCLRTKEEYEKLHKYEKEDYIEYLFYGLSEYIDLKDILGEIFILNPEFFMENLYGITRFYEDEENKEMARNIIEKFCFYEGEQILHECDGRITRIGRFKTRQIDLNLIQNSEKKVNYYKKIK